MALSSCTVGMRVQYGGTNGEVKRNKVLGVAGAEVEYDNGNRNCYVGQNYVLFTQNATAL